MASIDQRGMGWRARVRIPGHKNKSRTFDTQAEAEVWARRRRYGEEVTPEKKGREQESRRICAWRERPLAKLKLSQATTTHFVELRKERLAEGRAGNTIRLDLSLISNLYKVAKIEWQIERLGLVEAAAADHIYIVTKGARFSSRPPTIYSECLPIPPQRR